MKKQFNIIISLLKRLFTFVNLEKIIVIFIIGILSRFLLDKCENYNSILEFITCIITFCNLSIFPGLNYMFKEIVEYITYKLYSSDITTLHINPSNTSNNYKNTKNVMTIFQPSELSNNGIDFESRKKITSQIFEEIAQPTKSREVRVPSSNMRSQIYMGIQYYDKTWNAHGLYIKYYNIFNQERIWYVWTKGASNLRFSEFRPYINSNVNIWREINTITGTNVSREVRNLLNTDPFHMDKPQR